MLIFEPLKLKDSREDYEEVLRAAEVGQFSHFFLKKKKNNGNNKNLKQ